MRQDQKITYTVGDEKKLTDVLKESDVAPLLASAVSAGIFEASVTDAEGKVLWSQRGGATGASNPLMLPLSLEGEVVGAVTVKGPAENAGLLQGIAGLLRDAVSTLMHANLKRMLATEIHTSVVNLSYDELLDKNEKLQASEARYRELAESLERKVNERTAELKLAYARLLQQEKMASIGQLAAGVAHEINNPLGYISSNLNTLSKYLARMSEMLAVYSETMSMSGVPVAAKAAVLDKKKSLKLDFILSDTAELINQSLVGAEKVKKIVSDLKSFSHVDDAPDMTVDLNGEIDKTLNVLSHEISENARIIKEYHPLPAFRCNPALFCQVFLAIIKNALEARREGLQLSITSREAEGKIMLSFMDNGPGVPENLRQRIFDPFFTTKEVGAGTGMGLTVAYEIVAACGGILKLDETVPGHGASFTIEVPTGEVRHV